jgi:uncharacterized protein YkwD
MTMLAKPQAIESKVTMLGKAYLARCRRDLGKVFKLWAIKSSGNKAAQRQTLRDTYSTLRRHGIICARARHIFAWMRYGASKCLRINSQGRAVDLHPCSPTYTGVNLIVSSLRWKHWISALLSAALLSACGGGSDSGNAAQNNSNAAGQLTQEPGAPVLSNNIATDGFNWFNYRRSQIGLSPLVRNSLIDTAALGHSNYLNLNSTVAHTQIKGKAGFTGETTYDRLIAANYVITSSWGEVIAGITTNSGFYMAENLITAIYHRFVIFEPMLKEGGAGAAVNSSGYAYFTTDFAGNSRYGPGLPAGQIISYPFNGQTKVATSFSSNEEAPDPVPDQDVVGYPISVHANFDATLSVTAFSVRQHGAGTDLTVRLLSKDTDASNTSRSVAAIIPLAPLLAATTYDVSFIGKVNGANVTRSWAFTTR